MIRVRVLELSPRRELRGVKAWVPADLFMICSILRPITSDDGLWRQRIARVGDSRRSRRPFSPPSTVPILTTPMSVSGAMRLIWIVRSVCLAFIKFTSLSVSQCGVSWLSPRVSLCDFLSVCLTGNRAQAEIRSSTLVTPQNS
jgi:hypothetical protein